MRNNKEDLQMPQSQAKELSALYAKIADPREKILNNEGCYWKRPLEAKFDAAVNLFQAPTSPQNKPI